MQRNYFLFLTAVKGVLASVKRKLELCFCQKAKEVEEDDNVVGDKCERNEINTDRKRKMEY